jgi:hypothetical protein
MVVTLLKNWGEHKKGAQLDIKDPSVLDAGAKQGVFSLEEKPKRAK